MTADMVERGGARLAAYDRGSGLPVVFQHGLGGALDQVDETLAALPGVRRLTLECRAQGRSTAGRERPFSIAMFTDDVLAFTDAAGVDRFVAGGISMGAAIALRLAVRHPARVRALILARPAWLFDRAPSNMRPYAEVAASLRAAPPSEARTLFAQSPMAAQLAREAPANLESLLRWFERPDPQVNADLLADIANDGPGVTAEEAAALRIPTLVIGHGVDLAHPLETAKALARTIPGARFVEVVPKVGSTKAQHVAEIETAVTAFVTEML